jgi:hypothetical protein
MLLLDGKHQLILVQSLGFRTCLSPLLECTVEAAVHHRAQSLPHDSLPFAQISDHSAPGLHGFEDLAMQPTCSNLAAYEALPANLTDMRRPCSECHGHALVLDALETSRELQLLTADFYGC